MNVSSDILTGKTREHLVPLTNTPHFIHQQMQAAWHALSTQAAAEGMQVRVASAFRDFSSQLKIWNAKATGLRPLLDKKGVPLDFSALTPDEIVTSILRWSALPGASRHHWGTDIDVYDANALPGDSRIELVPQEAEPGGSQAAFSLWLTKHAPRFGFFRPYSADRGGVSPEWWHLSYRSVAEVYFNAFTLEIFRQTVREAEIELKSVILTRLVEIYQNYVRNVGV